MASETGRVTPGEILAATGSTDLYERFAHAAATGALVRAGFLPGDEDAEAAIASRNSVAIRAVLGRCGSPECVTVKIVYAPLAMQREASARVRAIALRALAKVAPAVLPWLQGALVGYWNDVNARQLAQMGAVATPRATLGVLAAALATAAGQVGRPWTAEERVRIEAALRLAALAASGRRRAGANEAARREAAAGAARAVARLSNVIAGLPLGVSDTRRRPLDRALAVAEGALDLLASLAELREGETLLFAARAWDVTCSLVAATSPYEATRVLRAQLACPELVP